MKLPEHVTFSFLLAQFGVQQEYGAAGTALMMAAGVLPDLDGLTVLGGWACHDRYHRVLGHGLPVTLLGPPALAAVGALLLGAGAFVPLWLWLHLALLAHLGMDILFYRWPVQLLWPFTTRGAGIGLVAWNDLVPTLLLYGGTALAILWPGPLVAGVSLGLLALYVTWRAVRRPGWSGPEAWLVGGWARRSPRVWRWLTGDFIS